jgi:hypothetical protein
VPRVEPGKTSAEDLATFQADYQAMLASRTASLSAGTKMFVRGILPSTAANAANRASYVAAQQAAVAAYNATSPAFPVVAFWNTDGWIVPVTDTADRLYPNVTGYVKIAARELTLFGGGAS